MDLSSSPPQSKAEQQPAPAMAEETLIGAALMPVLGKGFSYPVAV
ncbi:hypothetical protein VHA_002151 [Grimontia hollisae CIP 101886]|uniref:Uncharacterized protein n=1 Tax=Grimontia hollisae CIP 101886 TaxID=675812 RepID=D0I9L4_GRIHO|nr:hypothetical protein VHA_002151 [Grimontia hollisae CIP 101886]